MKIGLVLAGGGAKGAYQIGAWKALKELGIDKYIKYISGTSIGALNAILFMQGDINLAEEVWSNISKEKILPTDNKDLLTRGFLLALGSKNMAFVKKYIPKALQSGNISRSGLLEIIDKYIEFDKVLNSNIKCYATCTEMPNLNTKYFLVNEHNKENIKNILLATSALPMIYESEKIHDKEYLDGGMVDNVPVQPLYGEGCDIVLVIKLSKDNAVNKTMYPNTLFIEIELYSDEDEGVNAVLGFNADEAKRRIRIGYEQTMGYIEPFFKLFTIMDKEDKGKGVLFDIIKEKLINRNKINNNKEA